MAGDSSGGGRDNLAHNIPAERCLLGALLIERAALDAARPIVSGRDFYLGQHRLVFESITALSDQGEVADLITVQEELRRRGAYEQVGGLGFLVSLFDTAPLATDAAHHAETVRLCALWRGADSSAV